MATPTKTLVVGGTGATGRRLVAELLERGQRVRVIVRSIDRLPPDLVGHERLEVVEASVLDLSEAELGHHLEGCAAIASCLGHTMSFRGVFGPPYRLVTKTVRRLCRAAATSPASSPRRFVLMSSSGVRNRALGERVSFGQKIVLALLRLLVPPHADNERAADTLREAAGDHVAWAAVRPDGLVDAEEVTPYTVHPSPTRSAIFDAGHTSRINVAHFMAQLVTDDETWDRWRGQMPVIYNAPSIHDEEE